ncbi:hypothetical protein M670_01008 [Schinkia azotoformans MEV2011]|uniref:Uncharacterized protein n=1 Tax=Schinkia azotoformans MEV2011 TaxID=1348973 RepID=A0A072NQM4_SCHAZ|nr:hypothetical protein [Schinkia azotoformans]KEF39984.1 hypothetical protein M670_01008 [Schinkia azotoformans MEV2011]MEC1697282.1 hypothetical protein [Schinkia azotoformans]MEC1724321.1 hypothetical protein [Schinkia azotoformans]MEC1771524.1 hypothetical protein [Schinkia azotoformans]MED4367673.1 hypothetical protein [Schinkia azotoformans]
MFKIKGIPQEDKKRREGIIQFDNGVLSGDEGMIKLLKGKADYFEYVEESIPPVGYVLETDKWWQDAIAVILIASLIFDDVKFLDDVPEVEIEEGIDY